MLTEKPRCFYNTSFVITDLSDCHKLILTCLRGHFKSLLAKKINYRNHKIFNKVKFLHGLEKEIKVRFINTSKVLQCFDQFL